MRLFCEQRKKEILYWNRLLRSNLQRKLFKFPSGNNLPVKGLHQIIISFIKLCFMSVLFLFRLKVPDIHVTHYFNFSNSNFFIFY